MHDRTSVASMSIAVKIALSPLLVWQAVRTRARIPRLPEAEGPRAGAVGRGKTLRLLVAGDSSAAGVGVARQSEALAQPLARRLAEITHCRIEWQLLARTGLNTAQTTALLRQQYARADIAVIVTGVNDVVEQVPSHRAVQQREALANWLLHHGGVRHVVFLPLPPVHAFHGLPQPLRWVAGSDARRHNQMLRLWVRQRDKRVSLVDLDFPLQRGMMASDGFHPGDAAYRHTANALATHVARQLSSARTRRASHRVDAPPAAAHEPVGHRQAARAGAARDHRPRAAPAG
jgi:lysophospholipase L1-like esterase